MSIRELIAELLTVTDLDRQIVVKVSEHAVADIERVEEKRYGVWLTIK